MLTLITGGARSGKSKFGQKLCSQAERVVYVATAQASDEEMRERIRKHQESRPKSWLTIEQPIKVVDAVRQHGEAADIVLIDCLTVWLSNLLFEWRNEPGTIEQRARDAAAGLVEASEGAKIVAITNEVGSGIVPESPVARQFRDVQGLVNQQIARDADFVYLVTAGIPLRIKPMQAESL